MNQVFFTKDLSKAGELFDSAGFGKIIEPQDFVALKIHFGERGNKAFVKPDRSKPIVKKVKALKGKPFWTDSNTLYKGSRSNTIDHIQTAYDHGYTPGKTGAYVIIADGLEGKKYIELPVNGKHFKKVFIGSLIEEVDSLIAITHFKGHEVTGFGGAIKNISMGLASRAGKQQMHADLKPVINKEACTACGKCIEWCPESAIDWAADGKAEIDLAKCIGCGQCIVTCRDNAIAQSWAGTPDSVQEKMAEYASAVHENFKDKIAYLSFISDVSENCDCYDFNSEPIIPDVGILASFDPVALDQACVDMVNKTVGRIKSNDKFRTLWPNVDWSVQLKHAESLGLGSRKYELKEV